MSLILALTGLQIGGFRHIGPALVLTLLAFALANGSHDRAILYVGILMLHISRMVFARGRGGPVAQLA